MTTPGAAEPATARGELAAAAGACVLGAMLAFVASSRSWASATLVQAGVLAEPVRVDGAEAAPVVRALALVGLAGAVAVAATRRALRVLVGAVLLATGIGVAVAAALGGAGAATTAADAVADDRGASAAVTAWPWVAGVGGVVIAAAGLLTVVRGRGWPGLSSRYDRRRPSGPADPGGADRRGMWEALDRGDDPTR
jgi:uncharacterized membrane protein (TIGR02234 family)